MHIGIVQKKDQVDKLWISEYFSDHLLPRNERREIRSERNGS